MSSHHDRNDRAQRSDEHKLHVDGLELPLKRHPAQGTAQHHVLLLHGGAIRTASCFIGPTAA